MTIVVIALAIYALAWFALAMTQLRPIDAVADNAMLRAWADVAEATDMATARKAA